MSGRPSLPVGRAALAVSVVVGLAVPVASAQEVRVGYVHVMDLAGRPVTDVTQDEFEVEEGGREARVIAARNGSEPMKIALLVDNGDAMRAGQAVNPLRDAVAAFLEAVPPQHAVSLFTIGGQVRRLVDFTTDREELIETGRSIFTDQAGGVRFVDAIRETLDRRYDGDEAWPVFVALLSDAPESSAFMNDRRFLRFVNDLREAGVMIHVVQWSAAGRDRPDSATSFAVNLTGNTGGRYRSLAVATGMVNAMAELGAALGAHYEEMSSRYVVVYERPDPPGRRVRVRVTRPAVGVRLYPDRSLDR
ncbi:MAG: hypothetical protein OXH75_03055 [Acidobacteria bacterium]|nr:hypothetical protein [Acidobacteriota bacterium]